MDAALKALINFNKNEAIQRSSCCIFTKTSIYKNVIIDNGGICTLIDLIEQQISDPIISLAIDALLNVVGLAKRNNFPSKSNCGIFAILGFMERNLKNKRDLTKCFPLLAKIVGVTKDSMAPETKPQVVISLMCIAAKCVEDIMCTKDVLRSCELISNFVSEAPPVGLQALKDDLIPLVLDFIQSHAQLELRKLCCCALARANFSNFNKEQLKTVSKLINSIITGNPSENELIANCCYALRNICTLDTIEAKRVIIKSGSNKTLCDIFVRNREALFRPALTALKEFVGFSQMECSSTWFKISSPLLQWLKSKEKNEAIVSIVLDFVRKSLSFGLRCISVKDLSYLLHFSMKGKGGKDINKMRENLLSLLSIKGGVLSDFSDVSSWMLKNISDPKKQVEGCKKILEKLNDTHTEKGRYEFIEAVFVAMAYHRSDAEIQSLGCYVFCRGVDDKQNKQRMRNLNIIELVLCAMKTFGNSPEVQRNGARALECLVPFLGYGKSDALSAVKKAKKIVKDDKFCDGILKILERTNTHDIKVKT